MAPLKNPRHEKFVQLLLEGKTALDAYYARDDANAARLRRNRKVEERLTELQAEIAAKVPITIENLIAELAEISTAALSKNQYAAAVRAVLGKAQLAGLLIEKRQVEVTGSFDGCDTAEAIQAKMVEDFFQYETSDYHDVRPEDAEEIRSIIAEGVAFMGECWQRAREVVEAIKARPVIKINYKPPQSLPVHSNGKS